MNQRDTSSASLPLSRDAVDDPVAAAADAHAAEPQLQAAAGAATGTAPAPSTVTRQPRCAKL